MIKNLLTLFIVLIGLNLPSFAIDLSDPGLFTDIQSLSFGNREYDLEVAKKIMSNFEIPDTKEHLATLVIFKIGTDGSLVEYQISQSSGNTDYDNRVITAIENAAPYPLPKNQQADEIEVVLNMDLSIIQLIKMLEQFDSPLTSPTEVQTPLPAPKQPEQTIKQPKGVKFVNPDDIKDF